MRLNDCEARFGAAFNRGHGELFEFHLLSQQGEETQLFLLHLKICRRYLDCECIGSRAQLVRDTVADGVKGLIKSAGLAQHFAAFFCRLHQIFNIEIREYKANN